MMKERQALPDQPRAHPVKDGPLILAVNGGSSSIKFAAVSAANPSERRFNGLLDRIGTAEASLSVREHGAPTAQTRRVLAVTLDQGIQVILGSLHQRLGTPKVAGIGHRIVHGGPHLLDHHLVTPELIAELHRAQALDPAHLPGEIALLEGFRHAFPGVPQVACFDTAFHRDLPHVAQLLPIPRRFFRLGVRRLGFHGLSYTYLMSRLETLGTPPASGGRVILAHLGSGASMAAVRGGKPIDTTMAFTPTSGLMMASRPGDLDPGLLVYLMKDFHLSTAQMDDFISRECGMLGVSELSADMRDLVALRATDPRAGEAVDLFCYQAKKHLCAMAATLEGLDTLVFTGGIGEHAPEVRAGICAGLEFLGLALDASRNARSCDVISAEHSRVTVRIIPTDEEGVIVNMVRVLLERATAS